MGVALTAEEQAEAAQYGRDRDGYLGLSAEYWQYLCTGTLLNSKLRDLYTAADWKAGESRYHSDLEDVSAALLESASPTQALKDLDLTAVYRRLTASPFLLWNF